MALGPNQVSDPYDIIIFFYKKKYQIHPYVFINFHTKLQNDSILALQRMWEMRNAAL